MDYMYVRGSDGGGPSDEVQPIQSLFYYLFFIQFRIYDFLPIHYSIRNK